MTRDDEEAILALFAKLAEAEAKAPKRDPEAERLIAAGLARQPEAAYRMAQVLIVQDQALNASAQRIKRLEADLAAEQEGGFLSDLFGASPAPRPARATPPTGTGFLGGAAQTAAGVAGGLFLVDALAWAIAGDASPASTPSDPPQAEEDDGWW